jgi:hypothetical protein
MKIVALVVFFLIAWFLLNCIAALAFSYAFGDVVAPLFGWPRLGFWQSFCALWAAALIGAAFGAPGRFSASKD